MTWINPKRHHHATPHVDAETEHKLADFLVTHGRLVAKAGRPQIHVLGTCDNHDGTRDYSVRTFMNDDGSRKMYDSHIRQYETGRMRLIR